MTNLNSNILLAIFIGVILIVIIYYLNQNNDVPIPNEGTISEPVTSPSPEQMMTQDYANGDVIDELISQYNRNDTSNNTSKNFGPYDAGDDSRDFVYKKQKYTRRTPEDIKDLFDVSKMLPQEKEDWFDTEPLLTTKKIKGTQFIHPKYFMGENTIGSSKKNATHDVRGDVVIPKIPISPWGNSTIDPDNNLKGLCE